jgi:hypothetical protein
MAKGEDDFRRALLSRPHLVLLGAGASRAALPDGDRNGLKLPLMNDFAATVGLVPLLEELGVNPDQNFEAAFAELYEDQHPRLPELEGSIEKYFLNLQLPGWPTIYDYLVLSLREEDVIATFNWDPLLIQAMRRNRRAIHLILLHGNVAIGFCQRDNVIGLRGGYCSRCGRPFEPSKLLYPITTKDYASDPQIASQWEEFRYILSRALLFTIFGYSAPSTDVEAFKAIRDAWGEPQDRPLEEIEMIDIRDEGEVKATWDPLIHTHHYAYRTSYFDSWLGRQGPHAFRQFIAQTYEAQWIDDNLVPRNLELPELQRWFERMRQNQG